MMKKNSRSLNIWGVLNGFLAMCLFLACSAESDLEPKNASFNVEDGSLALSFNTRAGFVVFDDYGNPSFELLETAHPTMSFSGINANGTKLAYTTLAYLDQETGERESVSLEEAAQFTLSELVPTGDLVIESAFGGTKLLSLDDGYIVTASWHPSNPNLVAYSFSSGSTYGLAVHDLSSGVTEEVLQDDFTPEFIFWSDDGAHLGAYMADPYLQRKKYAHGHEQVYDIQHRLQSVPVLSLLGDEEVQPVFMNGFSVFSGVDSSMLLTLKSGGNIALPEGPTGRAIEVSTASNIYGKHINFSADQIRNIGPSGIAYVNFTRDGGTLFASNGVLPPKGISTQSSVSYYIPMPYYEDAYITQVGNSYSGGGCSVSSHTGSMSYAVDFQIPGTSNDEVVASAGGTIAGYGSGVTCNGLDSSGCSIYTGSSCSDYGGWGNYIVIGHSDGKYTKYTHLENANFKVTGYNSIGQGCWMADEGGTGNTIGNKNGCGDHVHFQWQNSSSLGGSSVYGSFVETSLSSSSCSWIATSSGASSCSL